MLRGLLFSTSKTLQWSNCGTRLLLLLFCVQIPIPHPYYYNYNHNHNLLDIQQQQQLLRQLRRRATGCSNNNTHVQLRQLFDSLAKEFNIQRLDDWYNVKFAHVTSRIIGAVQAAAEDAKHDLASAAKSKRWLVVRALESAYPEHQWELSRFKDINVPRGYWKNVDNQRKFFESLRAELGIETLDDWYRIGLNEIRSRGGSGLIYGHHGGSLVRALQAVYPEHDWQIHRFSTVPKGFWKDLQHQRQFFDAIAKDLGVEQLDDWEDITVDRVFALGGKHLLCEYYDGSLMKALAAVYPEHAWSWSSWSHVRGGGGGEEEGEGEGGGHPSPNNNNNNNSSSSSSNRRRRRRHRLRQQRLPYGFWTDVNNHRQFLDALGREEFNIEKLDDWHRVRSKEVKLRGGRFLLNRFYGNSLRRALLALYPDHPWQFSERDVAAHSERRVPYGHWRDLANQRQFFDRLGKELLGIDINIDDGDGDGNGSAGGAGGAGGTRMKQLDRWYQVTLDEVNKRGGRKLLQRYYGNSLKRALATIYPDHDWQDWRFRTCASANGSGVTAAAAAAAAAVMAPGDADGINNNNNNNSSSSSSDNNGQLVLLKQCIEALASEFNIHHLDDWYRVSNMQLQQHVGPYGLIRRNGGLAVVLKRLYPGHAWDDDKFSTWRSSKKRSSQRWLRLILQKIIPQGREILEDFRHPNLTFSRSQQPMEFDVYVPSLALAFEYHGAQHYKDIPVFGANASHYQQQDDEKVLASKHAGITLISIPYWWDRTAESLAATICSLRPDLAPELRVVSSDDTNNNNNKNNDNNDNNHAARPIPTEPPPQPPRAATHAAAAAAAAAVAATDITIQHSGC